MDINDTAVVLAQSKQDIKSLLDGDDFKMAIRGVLGDAVRAERFVRVALSASMRKPKLLQCTKLSFFLAMLECSAYGLEPDSRKAHLIPFKNNKNNGRLEVQLIIDYKGIVDLVRRSGELSYIHADVVYPDDEFDFQYGSGAFLKHKPNLDRGVKKPIATYSFVKLKDNSEDFLVMSPAQVAKIRARSKTPNDGPWVTDPDEMWKKSVFRNQSKWLPVGEKVVTALERDEVPFDMDGALDLAAGLEPTEPGEGEGEKEKSELVTKLEKSTGKSKPGLKRLTPEAIARSAATAAVREVDDLPDPHAVSDDRLYYEQSLWRALPDRSDWVKVYAALPDDPFQVEDTTIYVGDQLYRANKDNSAWNKVPKDDNVARVFGHEGDDEGEGV